MGLAGARSLYAPTEKTGSPQNANDIVARAQFPISKTFSVRTAGISTPHPRPSEVEWRGPATISRSSSKMRAALSRQHDSHPKIACGESLVYEVQERKGAVFYNANDGPVKRVITKPVARARYGSNRALPGQKLRHRAPRAQRRHSNQVDLTDLASYLMNAPSSQASHVLSSTRRLVSERSFSAVLIR